MTATLIVSSLLLLCAWIAIRVRQSRTVGNDASPKHKSPYSAVSVRGPVTACDAAKCIGGERYLSSESPTLPLAECDRKEQCECYFANFDDRRRPHDRRSPYSVNTNNSGTGMFKEERRQGNERRANTA